MSLVPKIAHPLRKAHQSIPIQEVKEQVNLRRPYLGIPRAILNPPRTVL